MLDIVSGIVDDLLQPVGIGGFTAYALVNERTSGTRMLPSSVLESGSYANDHIIREPITVDMEIDISDIYIDLQPTSPVFRELDNTVGAISQFIPTKTHTVFNQMNEIRNSIDQAFTNVNNVMNMGGSIFSFLGGMGFNSHRVSFIQALHALYESSQLITLQTRHKSFKNMALSSFDYVTDNERQAITANLTFSQVKFRSLLEVAIEELQQNPSGAASASVASVSEKGSQTVGASSSQATERSFLDTIFF